MRQHETPEQRSPREGGGEPKSSAIPSHSLAAAAVCVATGATIALVAILGQPG